MPVQPGSELMCTWLEPFRSCFTGPTFRYVLVLVTGATSHQPGAPSQRC